MEKTYFDKITASPAALAEFLASIPALETPWDEVFQRTYCAACSAENCDAENCPHQAERNSPAWFLAQEVANDGNFDDISAAEVAAVEEWMANYPRRILGWKTPQMLYDEYMTVAA